MSSAPVDLLAHLTPTQVPAGHEADRAVAPGRTPVTARLAPRSDVVQRHSAAHAAAWTPDALSTAPALEGEDDFDEIDPMVAGLHPGAPMPVQHRHAAHRPRTGTAGSMLSAKQLATAAAANVAWHRKLRFSAAAFGGGDHGSEAFAQRVAKLQHEHGLHVDGIVGPETFAAIGGSTTASRGAEVRELAEAAGEGPSSIGHDSKHGKASTIASRGAEVRALTEAAGEGPSPSAPASTVASRGTEVRALAEDAGEGPGSLAFAVSSTVASRGAEFAALAEDAGEGTRSPASEDAVEATRGARDAEGAADRAKASAVDSPKEYDETRATLEVAPVQARAASGRARSDDDTHALAANGVQGSGHELPFLRTIKPLFGAFGSALDGIRSHTNPTAVQAARAIGADAYATGNDIAFAVAPTIELVGHEAAHVVQQRHGVALSGGVGAAGDVYERHAEAVGATVARGESAEALLAAGPSGGGISHAIQRREGDDAYTQGAMRVATIREAKDWNETMQDTPSTSDDNNFMNHPREGAKPVGKVKPGHAGYGHAVSDAGAAQGEAAIAAGAYGQIAPDISALSARVAAYLSAGVQTQLAAVQDMAQEAHGLTGWQAEAMAASQQWATQQAELLIRQQSELASNVTAYAFWAALARMAQLSEAELEQTMKLVGFDPKDRQATGEFTKDLEHGVDMAQGLVEAKVLGGGTASVAHRAEAHRNDEGPQGLGTPTEEPVEELTEAYAKVVRAHDDVQSELLKLESDAAKGDADAAAAQIAGIQQVIGFWAGLGGSVMAWKGIGTSLSNAASKAAGHGRDARAGYWHGRAERAGQHGQGGIAKQALYREDAIRETAADAPAEAAIDLPLSPMDALSMIVEWSFDDEIAQHEGEQAKGNAHASAATNVLNEREYVGAQDRFADAVSNLQRRAALAQSALRRRDTEHRKVGADLDTFATEHRTALQASGHGSLAKGAGSDTYSSLMALVGKVREHLALCWLATNAGQLDRVQTSANQMRNERNHPGLAAATGGPAGPKQPLRETIEAAHRRAPQMPPWSGAEDALYHTMTGAYRAVIDMTVRAQVRFGMVEAKMRHLDATLHDDAHEDDHAF